MVIWALLCYAVTLLEVRRFHSKHRLYLEEGHGGSIPHCPVFDPSLFRQVVCWVDGRIHSFHSEEGSQVGRVGGDDD